MEEKEEEQQQALSSVAHARYRYAEKYSYKFIQIRHLWAFGSQCSDAGARVGTGNTSTSVMVLLSMT